MLRLPAPEGLFSVTLASGLQACKRMRLTFVSAAVFICVMAVAQAPPATAPDYSGMYTFLREGEFVQLTVEPNGRLSGFISRYADTESDKGLFLDQWFASGSLNGDGIQWKTRPVHAVWYEFEGSITRGEGKTPSDEGYYCMRGSLTEYSSDAQNRVSSRSRHVTFTSFPREEPSAQPPKGN